MASTTKYPGRRPEKRPYGRHDPPPGYPQDREQYADPENLLYPVNTPVRARVARRYFDDEKNRSKYSEEERQYIDARINDALLHFGFAVTVTDESTVQRTRKSGVEISADDLENSSVEELLLHFLGKARLERAQAIDSDLVNVESITGSELRASVKEYRVEVNVPERYIKHNCPDWENWSAQKMMCKHVGKVFLTLDEQIAAPLLRQIYREKAAWRFLKMNE